MNKKNKITKDKIKGVNDDLTELLCTKQGDEDI